MNVAELITELSKLPPDLMVVHSTGTMQDREEVEGVRLGQQGETAWTARTDMRTGGDWVQVL